MLGRRRVLRRVVPGVEEPLQERPAEYRELVCPLTLRLFRVLVLECRRWVVSPPAHRGQVRLAVARPPMSRSRTSAWVATSGNRAFRASPAGNDRCATGPSPGRTASRRPVTAAPATVPTRSGRVSGRSPRHRTGCRTRRRLTQQVGIRPRPRSTTWMSSARVPSSSSDLTCRATPHLADSTGRLEDQQALGVGRALHLVQRAEELALKVSAGGQQAATTRSNSSTRGRRCFNCCTVTVGRANNSGR
jgi:hypothetical protein